MSKIQVPTSFNIELEFTIPEFHRRMFAWLIDLLILFAYLFIADWFLTSFIPSNRSAKNELYNFSFLSLIFYAPSLVYHLLCEVFMNGQSVGKRLLHIRVVSENGGRPSLYQYLLRWLIRPIDFLFTMGLGAIISTMITEKNQRLGDLAAGTLLISTRAVSELSETVFQEVHTDYQPRYAHAVLRLTDRDLNMIKSIVDSVNRSGNYKLAGRTSAKVRQALAIGDEQDDLDFLETILKDYNYVAAKH